MLRRSLLSGPLRSQVGASRPLSHPIYRHCSSHATPTAPRTRFAPSPTGHLHLGSLRTALYNYLYAKQTGGQFILRLEDTDKKRTVEGAEQGIYEILRWAGIEWDEGPDVGGPYGPYRQSDRSDIHREHVNKLIESGHAYRCFCSPARLKTMGLRRSKLALPTDYDRACAKLSKAESDERAHKGEGHVVRLKMPDDPPPFHDLVHGPIKHGSNAPRHSAGAYEDPILLKSDGLPTYHLANVVDDHHMAITHVMRATEWLPSTPKHITLYNAFGWTPPTFAHVGLLQNKERKKLSKRDGDVNVGVYREKGYLPESLNNFVALLGWSHTEKSDVMGMQDLIRQFSMDRLTAGNTIVDFGKLDYLQRHHVEARAKSGTAEDIIRLAQREIANLYGTQTAPEGPVASRKIDEEFTRRLFEVNAHNYITAPRFASSVGYFFQPPSYVDATADKAFKRLSKTLAEHPEDVGECKAEALRFLSSIPESEWTPERLKGMLSEETHGWKGQERQVLYMKFLRWALAGGANGPPIHETVWLIGKERSVYRVQTAPLKQTERDVLVRKSWEGDVETCRAVAVELLETVEWTEEGVRGVVAKEWKRRRMQVIFEKFLRWAVVNGDAEAELVGKMVELGREQAVERIKGAITTEAQREFLAERVFGRGGIAKAGGEVVEEK
ncbi:glutamyl-tRNA synthetase [Ascobolus immersus RN42]|uniref:Glutamate--tRNA ligase, mitochondrial n=1 Tax=Ascobolus immersus RN42 TaxID=1160509 RepID=A0A3N4I6F6_ASCIM|nr:glutamyl-tRNA synthetase [Ascobolus immersus RN42]